MILQSNIGLIISLWRFFSSISYSSSMYRFSPYHLALFPRLGLSGKYAVSLLENKFMLHSKKPTEMSTKLSHKSDVCLSQTFINHFRKWSEVVFGGWPLNCTAHHCTVDSVSYWKHDIFPSIATSWGIWNELQPIESEKNCFSGLLWNNTVLKGYTVKSSIVTVNIVIWIKILWVRGFI